MHAAIEAARKAAGIGSLKRNYPANPKERGIVYWSAFIAAIERQLVAMDERRAASVERIEELASRRADLERQLAEAWENDPDHPANQALALAITAEGGGPEDGGLHPRDCNCDACCD